ncbi:Mpo1-like protein [Methylobacter sp.]|uniref:Mpo1-like protein n=1 Tax=Methylobacter sp. TaxID=2051955 RepID=UPI003DA56275
MAVISQSVIEGVVVNEVNVYRTFKEFYPFYPSEHANRVSRRLHFVDTSIDLVLLMSASFTAMWWLVALAFVQGYVFTWVGHFFSEHNKPATFVYLWLSFLGDWRIWWDMLTGKIRFRKGAYSEPVH